MHHGKFTRMNLPQVPGPVQLYTSKRGRVGAEGGRRHRRDGEV